MRIDNLKFVLLFILFAIIAVLTPHIIQGHILIPEEFAESVLIFADIVLAYIFYLIYRHDIKKINEAKQKVEKSLLDSYQYIGQINSERELMDHFMGLIFLRDYQDKPKEHINILLANLLVTVAKSDRGLLRFIDNENKNTIREFFYHKEGDQFVTKLSNASLVEGDLEIYNHNGIQVIKSGLEDKKIICVLCFKKKVGEEIDIKMLKLLLNQIHLLFLLANTKN